VKGGLKIVDKLSPKKFELALERATIDPEAPQPKCRTWVDEHPGEPNPWTDWATDPEEREPHEAEELTFWGAKMLCTGCKLESICTEAALAKPPFHGGRGNGLRFENGKRIRD